MKGKTAQEFIDDLKAGVRDEDLMRKYRFSRAAFYRYKAVAKDLLLKKRSVPEKARLSISARRFLDDVKAHMDEQALMEKYHINQRQLQHLFRQLIEAGLMSPLELADRLKVTKSQVAEAFVEMGKAVTELD